MNTESRRKASAAYHAKRKADGLKKVTLWLSPEARAKLETLKVVVGSKDKAADAAILAWTGPGVTAGDIDAMVGTGLVKPRRGNPKIVIEPKASLKAKKSSASAHGGVQFGPSKSKPGSRLIEKKKRRTPNA